MSDRRVALGLVCAALVCAALGQRASAGQIDPALAARLAHLPVHAMTPVIVELDGKPAIEQVAAQVGNLPRTARGGAIAAQLRSQFDGRKTVAEIYTSMGSQGSLPQWEDFYSQFEDLYVKLNGVNHLLLRFRS